FRFARAADVFGDDLEVVGGAGGEARDRRRDRHGDRAFAGRGHAGGGRAGGRSEERRVGEECGLRGGGVDGRDQRGARLGDRAGPFLHGGWRSDVCFYFVFRFARAADVFGDDLEVVGGAGGEARDRRRDRHGDRAFAGRGHAGGGRAGG